MSAPDRPRPTQNTVRIFHTSLFVGAMLIFLIPGACLGFFYYTQSCMDDHAISALEDQLINEKVPEDRKEAVLAHFRAHPVSEAMASDAPRDVAVQQSLHKLTRLYGLYRWSIRGAWISLGVTAAALLPLLICITLSRRSRSTYYWSLRIGWQTLRLFASAQVLLQGALLVALAFGACEWFGFVSVKIIGGAAIGAFAAAILLIRAIFTKLPSFSEVEGRCLSKEEAPALWNRVKQMAARMHTTPPDRIVAGIDPSFFVTGGPMMVDGKKLEGRSLYLSLPLLKTMSIEEADSILGHEMAHFSGNDTEFTQKIAPLLQRYHYFLACTADGLTLPIFHFMNIFWCLYQKNLGTYSREREFRADRIGANFTNPAAFGRALIKFIAYSNWRGSIEASAVTAGVQAGDAPVRERIEAGFSEALCSFIGSSEALAAEAPHPFDSHPPLSDRLAALGLDAEQVLQDSRLLQPAEHSWYQEIDVAEAAENSLWSRHQENLDKVRDAVTAITMLPEDQEQEAFLRNAYPPLSFTCGKKTALLEHDCIGLSNWDTPVFFNDILNCSLESYPGMTRLTIATKEPGGKWVEHKFYPKKYKGTSGDLLEAFQTYYGRYRAAVEHRKSAPEWSEAPASATQPRAVEALPA
jgi:Zn-dependent protease with chaperone function